MRAWTEARPVVAALLLAAAPTVAVAQAGSAPELTDSTSFGFADSGRLESPFALVRTDSLVPVTNRHYGTRELVGLLTRSAAAVARAAPGSVLAVGDLSAEEGGPLSPHVSHQSGRDADVGFFVLDQSGRPQGTSTFIRMMEDGTGRNRAGAHFSFDVERNWDFLAALVGDPMAEIQLVLVTPYLRDRLLAWGAEHAAPDVLERVRLITTPIRGSDHHDDHFHVRIYCPVGDRPECLDTPPLHPWYPGMPSPNAIAAARAADRLLAARARREQEEGQRQLEALAQERERQAAAERERAAALAREPALQEASERERAAALAREEAAQSTAERQRAAALARERQRVLAEQRRRDAELLAAQRRAASAEQARAAELYRDRLAERARAGVHARQAAPTSQDQALLRRYQAEQARRLRAIQREAERSLARTRAAHPD